ncbi:hypothetical protein TD95_000094 [Thielaviopsis punctulata]|uniref:Alpha-galactosidase n=1 Tax=Thielaviopsis punctulata TaxID=72032 RepID=A0A0F4Z810_9PEZI|nr:hypothetical protein TD95_000094 [Thielaviopsis punctulata]
MTADADLVIQGAEHQAYYKHYIAPPASFPDHNIRVHIASYPPLAQTTCISAGNLTITAVLETSRSTANEVWEVSLWSNIGSDNLWHETPLTLTRDLSVFLHCDSSSCDHVYFTHTVKVDKTFQFTLKYRSGVDRPWVWAQHESGIGDGTVIVSNPQTSGIPTSLDEVISGLNPDLDVRSRVSQSPKTNVWRVGGMSVSASSDRSEFQGTRVGVPWNGYVRWFGLARAWEPWLCPVHGKDKFDTDKSVIMASFLSSKGLHMVALAVSGANDVNTFLKPGDNGCLVLYTRNDGTTTEEFTLIVAVGKCVQNAIAAAVYEARSMVQSQGTDCLASEGSIEKAEPSATEAPAKELSDEVKVMWNEAWYDGLGYYQKIHDALDQLAANNIKISTLIIDDNWQSIIRVGDGQTHFPMTRFEALKSAFPEGLKKTVASIKSKHQNIKHVAVWHALFGYWGGVDPNGDIGQKYKTVETQRRDAMGGSMYSVSAEDVGRFYNDFYSFLSSCGIDGVKTDGQYTLDTFVSAEHRRTLGRAYQDAWSLACLRWFSNKVISCMSQTPQIIFHSQLPRNKPPVVMRNSDDFFPHVPASHPWHVWANAYNSLLTHYLNVVPDWDMFQTVHDYSEFHAAARCVSGGPVYITDAPGQYNIALIKQMTAETVRGRTVILRPSITSKAADPYVGYHDDVLLKVVSYHGGSAGFPIMGVFNVSSCPLTEVIHLTSFSGILASSTQEYIIRGYTTGKTSAIMTPDSLKSLVGVSLAVRGYEIFTAYKLASFKGKTEDKVCVANLGLLGKMTGAAAIVGNTISKMETGGRVYIDTYIKALGVLGIYISSLPKMTVDGNFMVTIMGQVIPTHTVSVSKVDPHIVEIDIEMAWKEMELRSGWANEVEVKIYFDLV